jgi:hypothetical protein
MLLRVRTRGRRYRFRWQFTAIPCGRIGGRPWSAYATQPETLTTLAVVAVAIPDAVAVIPSAFDDVANQESLVHSGDPTSIGITLDAF